MAHQHHAPGVASYLGGQQLRHPGEGQKGLLKKTNAGPTYLQLLLQMGPLMRKPLTGFGLMPYLVKSLVVSALHRKSGGAEAYTPVREHGLAYRSMLSSGHNVPPRQPQA